MKFLIIFHSQNFTSICWGQRIFLGLMRFRRFTYLQIVICIFVAGSLSWPCAVFSQPEQNLNKQSRTFLLVHGAWGGGWAFKQLASILRASGHIVYRPTLTGLGERVHLTGPDITLDTHINDILKVIEFEDLQRIVLVGHSYGGMVVTAVADRVPEKIEQLIYIDAHLPEDGESMFDLISPERRADLLLRAETHGQGWNIPPLWPENGKNVPHPLATFQNAVKLNNSSLEGIKGLYILTLELGAVSDAFSASAQRARARGWRYRELRTGHNPQWTMPHKLAKILMSVD
jgi:pimeloyl-ACP methyl ester carboxylesterase